MFTRAIWIMTSIVHLAHGSFIGLRVRKLHGNEGNNDQTHYHLLCVHEDLLFELNDIVLAVS